MIEKKDTYTFSDFKEIVKELRGEHGCPWDKKQTHQSLKSCLTNECQEVIEAIDNYEQTGDYENLCEELGDVLLQIVLHSQIAEESGHFTVEDVITGISKKMIRRHPHVFHELSPAYRNGKSLSWAEIKRLEKEGVLD